MGREVASLEGAGIRQDGKWLVLNPRTENFWIFQEKIWYPQIVSGSADLKH